MVASHTVCAPIVGPGMGRAMEQLIEAATEGVDAVEVRLDLIGPDGLAVLDRACSPARTGTPPSPVVIATCRGGDVATHLAMVAARPAYIDVDLADAPAVVLAVREALDDESQLIVSHHDWDGTPSLDTLIAVREECISLGADIVKLVTTAHSRADALVVVKLLMSSDSDTPTISFSMGEHGRASRILAPMFGSPISYVALSAGDASAPGQLSVSHTDMLRGIAGRAVMARAGVDMYAVVGNPIAHSLSPVMHNAAYAVQHVPAVYVPLLVEDIQEMLTAVQHGEFDSVVPLRGLSVTVPHKEGAYAWLTTRAGAQPGAVHVDSAATAIGAVNTVTFERSQGAGDAGAVQITATNTDWIGIVRTAEELVTGAEPAGEPAVPHRLRGMTVLVIGAGGTARAAAYGLIRSGAAVTVVNRTKSRAVTLADALGCRAAEIELLRSSSDSESTSGEGFIADILVNATSVGLGELAHAMPLPETSIDRFRYVVDAVYAPGGTPLINAARSRGIPAAGGESILLHQGVAQYEHWLNREAPISEMASALDRVMRPVRVATGHSKGAVQRFVVPGSKSITQRALICAALAEGTSTITGALLSEDTQLLMGALRSLGVQVEQSETTTTVTGVGGSFAAHDDTISLGNNGTATRLLTALVCLGHGQYRIDGTSRLRERPVGPLVDALRSLGAEIEYEIKDGHLPIRVTGGTLTGGGVAFGKLDSSQYVSALMMVAPYAPNGIEITLDAPLVSAPYVEITRRVLRDFGVRATVSDSVITVECGAYSAQQYLVEADASSASYPAAAAAILGRSIHVPGVLRSSIQGDAGFLRVVEQLGASLEWSDRGVTIHGADLVRGNLTFDMGDMPDVVPTLAVLSAFRDGTTDIVNVAHLRVKESDRISATVEELRRIGCEADELPDGLRIRGQGGLGLRGAEVQTYDDHRIAMAFALAGLRNAEVRIEDPACVAKSFASFWDEIAQLGFRQYGNRAPEQIVLIGYRATGKTSIGRSLALELASPFVDSDSQLVAKQGRTVAAIVGEGGWETFRTLEAQTLSEIAQGEAPIVLATGGGALTDERSRKVLRRMRDRGAVFVWLQASPETIARWITEDETSREGRPPLTGSGDATSSHEDVLGEVRRVLAERIPAYEEFADIAVDTEGWDTERITRAILNALSARHAGAEVPRIASAATEHPDISLEG